MNALAVRGRNFRSYESFDLELPEGSVAIVGDNGAGKSSLMTAITLALFGPANRSLADYLKRDGLDTEMSLELEFEHGGQVYRVRRGYSAKGRGKAALDFERFVDSDPEDNWEPLTRESAAATQELICATIGLTRETFHASGFLAQGNAAAFTEAQPRDRKRILCDVLGLDVWDALLERCRLELRVAESAIAVEQAKIGSADEELARLPKLREDRAALATHIEEKARDLAAAEAKREEAAAALATAREGKARLDAARELLAARAREYEGVRDRLVEIAGETEKARELDREREGAQALADRVADLEREGGLASLAVDVDAELGRLAAELGAQQKLAAEKRELLKKMEGDPFPECDRCGQTLEVTAAREHVIAQVRAEAREAGEKVIALTGEHATLTEKRPKDTRSLNEIQAELTAAQAARATVAALTARLERMAELHAERDAKTRTLPDLQRAVSETNETVAQAVSDVGDLEGYEHRETAAARVLADTRQILESFKTTEARVAGELDRLVALEATVAAARRSLAELQSRLDLLKLAERAYGRDGIPALVIENAAVPQIEAEVNKILAELGTPYDVELRTQKDLKSGDGVKDELYILVDGGEYLTYSGGERTRINIAFRRALARLLRHRRGVELELLVIDEPDGLDASGFAALAESVKGATDDFARVYVISHHPDLQTAFDQSITVVKENGRSRIEGAPVREAVPA